MNEQEFNQYYQIVVQQFAGDQQAAQIQSARLRKKADALEKAGYQTEFFNCLVAALLCELYVEFGSDTGQAWTAVKDSVDSTINKAESQAIPDCPSPDKEE